jgi:Icc-related predicted phosphoesterase
MNLSEQMKIAALTDLHGHYEIADAVIALEKPDVLVIGGDLTTLGSVREAEEVLLRLKRHVGVLLCVAGNMDLPQHDDLFLRLGVSMNGRGIHVGRVGFSGLSSAPISTLRTPYELPEETLLTRGRAGAGEIKNARIRIFVPHAPPYGTKLDIIHSGIHVGSTAVREIIEEEEPDAVICGHIHEGRGLDFIGKSALMNCGPAMHGCYGIAEIGQTVRLVLKKI